jgi:hypothetical protein
MTYDPDQDQSERFDWPKYCDEHLPTEQEQDTWARISIAVTAIVTAIVWIVYIMS